MLSLGAADPAPYTFEHPPFLNDPVESKSLFGSTYAYTSRETTKLARLLITLMPAGEIRARFSALSDTECINLFLEQIRNEHEGFFVVSMARPMRVGTQEFLRFRWTGEKSDKTMTGVLGCGQLGGFYVVVHFSDELRSATRSFPAIRSSLRSLTPGGG